ncbi:MAG: hypothetical protein ACSHYF_03275 [Verrucomicrobiaceae bacterium]
MLAIKIIAALFLTSPAIAEEVKDAITLDPGKTAFLEFPDLGKTWRDQPTRSGLYLPTDYTTDKKFPLFVWFGGGAGSDSPAKAIQITEGKGFICLALPYRHDKGQKGGWQTPWSYYETILDRVEKTIPNIDPKHRICAGFSSGGAAILHQIGHSDGAFQAYFHAFMPGGAGWPMGGLDTLKGRPMLAFMGDGDKRLPNFKVLEEEATAAGINFTLLLFKDTKHALPADQFPKLRAWMTQSTP